MAARALEVLTSSPGTPFSVAEIAARLGVPSGADARRPVAITVGNSAARSGRTSPWRQVRRVKRGVYVYDPQHADEQPEHTCVWSELGRDEHVVVLRGPDGVLYAATPISTQPASTQPGTTRPESEE